jgi:hypothetical protein
VSHRVTIAKADVLALHEREGGGHGAML